jgi:hypothetical protein
MHQNIVFHIHVPKTGGITAARTLWTAGFTPVTLDPPSNSFFREIDEAWWRENWYQKRWHFFGHYRLAHPTLTTMRYPHLVTTLLRDPSERVLSNYNFAIRDPSTPWHGEVASGQMGFIEYVEKLLGAFGQQYSYFDDTGTGDVNLTGNGSVERCLDNLIYRVNFYGFTKQFNQFIGTIGRYLQSPISAPPTFDRTVDHLQHDPSWVPLKHHLDGRERNILTDMLRDDLWFYKQARRIYEDRRAGLDARRCDLAVA